MKVMNLNIIGVIETNRNRTEDEFGMSVKSLFDSFRALFFCILMALLFLQLFRLLCLL